MKRKTIFGILALVTVGLLVTGASAFAFKPMMDEQTREEVKQAVENEDYQEWKEAIESTLTEEKFNTMVEQYNTREAIIQAIENEDYNAWKSAIENTLTEEKFNSLVERYNDTSDKGMPGHGGMSGAIAGPVLFGDKETQEEITNAIENEDYQAWKDAVTESMTEEKFNSLVERYNGKADSEVRGHGGMRGHGIAGPIFGDKETQEEITNAIENEDYQAWKDAVTESMTEEKFNSLVERYNETGEKGFGTPGTGSGTGPGFNHKRGCGK